MTCTHEPQIEQRSSKNIIDGATALALARRRFRKLSADGIRVYPGSAPQDIHADQVETAMAFLKLLRPTAKPTVGTGSLKHHCEDWGGLNGLCAYISRGALISAAVALGLTVRPNRSGADVEIGVSIKDLRKLNEQTRVARIERRGRIAASSAQT
jgi:hypothetical protein